jgi:hypothetical protein
MICFMARPLHLRVISIGTVLEKQFETRNFQLEGQRQVETQDSSQTYRQTDTESQSDRLGRSQSLCGGLEKFKISRTYRESTKTS